MNTATQTCYCGSGESFAQCCEPLLGGKQAALTAEQLMRSRYSAFCTYNIDYLIATHHPSKHETDDREQLKKTLASCQWLQLKIISCNRGLANDNDGQVKFIAVYQENDQLFQLAENSQFIKEHNQWFYYDGVATSSQQKQTQNPGRNEPCWCGSGKKYKKCHG